MANTRQSEKRARQSKRRELHNVQQRTSVRTVVKKVLKALQSKDQTAAAEAFKKASSLIDKVAGRHIIPHNRAARLKSRLHAKLKAL